MNKQSDDQLKILFQILNSRMNNRYCDIVVRWVIIRQLWSLQTIIDCGMLSLPDTLWILLAICLNGLKHCLKINGFKPTVSWLIVKIFGNRVKFLELFDRMWLHLPPNKYF